MDPLSTVSNTIFLLITIFTNGPMVMVPDSNLLTQVTCNKRAGEQNGRWRLEGDKEIFQLVHALCVEKKS